MALLTPLSVAADLPSRPTPGSLAPGAPPSTQAGSGGSEALHELAVGTRGPEVAALQRRLREVGARIRADGTYGPATREAVAALQRRFGLAVTGAADTTLLRRLGLRQLPGGHGGVAVTVAGGRFLRAFPMGGDDYSYVDSWGAARAQGGHEGTDILAPRGAPVRAATYGVIERLSRVETTIGGIWIWIRDPAGNTYYYAHLESITPGLQAGSEVWPGQVIGANGNSGDARYGVTHVHFEIHPGGGAAAPSYGDLVAVDPLRRSGAAAG